MSKILLIEDDETMRDGMSQILKKAGHEVMDVSNGPDGVEFCRKETFDLIITDYRMNEMNGLEVLDQVKSIDENVDAILITAYGTIDMAVEAMRKGAADYLQKPVNFYELILRIEKIKNFKKLVKNAQDLLEAMDVTEQNAAETIQHLEMNVAELKSVVSEIRQVVMCQSIDAGKCIDRVLDIISSY